MFELGMTVRVTKGSHKGRVGKVVARFGKSDYEVRFSRMDSIITGADALEFVEE